MIKNLNTKVVKKLLSFGLLDQATLSLTTFLTLAFGVKFLDLEDHSIVAGAYLSFFSLSMLSSGLFYSVINTSIKHTEKPIDFLSQIFTNSIIFSAICILILIIVFSNLLAFLDVNLLFYSAIFVYSNLIHDSLRRCLHLLHKSPIAFVISFSTLTSRLAAFIFIDDLSLVSFFFLLILTELIPVVVIILSGFVPLRFGFAGLSGYFYNSKWGFFAAFPMFITVHSPIMLASSIIGSTSLSVLVTLRSLTNVTNVFVGLLDTTIPILLSAGLKLNLERLVILFYLVTSIIISQYGDVILGFLYGSKFEGYTLEFLLLWLLSGLNILIRLRLVKLRLDLVTSVEMMGFSIGALILTFSYVLLPLGSMVDFILVMLLSYFSVFIVLHWRSPT